MHISEVGAWKDIGQNHYNIVDVSFSSRKEVAHCYMRLIGFKPAWQIHGSPLKKGMRPTDGGIENDAIAV